MATIHSRGVTTGLAILGLLAVFDLVTAFFPPVEDVAAGPFEILVFGVVLGLGSLVLLSLVWRGRRGWPAWGLVALRAISGLLTVPAFFVELPPVWIALAAVFLVLTIVGIVLVRPTLRREPAAA